jgi:hypothetical protein
VEGHPLLEAVPLASLDQPPGDRPRITECLVHCAKDRLIRAYANRARMSSKITHHSGGCKIRSPAYDFVRFRTRPCPVTLIKVDVTRSTPMSRSASRHNTAVLPQHDLITRRARNHRARSSSDNAQGTRRGCADSRSCSSVGLAGTAPRRIASAITP